MITKKEKINNKNQKITFRKVIKKDLEILRDWRNDENIFKFNSQFILLNMFQQKKWFNIINSKKSDRIMFMVFLKNRPVGVCGLIHIDRVNHSADVALILGEQKIHGKGVGTKVLKKLVEYGFHKLYLNRIGADIIEVNEKSLGLFKKLNFQEEVINRESHWRYGKWWDMYKLSLLRQDYKNLG